MSDESSGFGNGSSRKKSRTSSRSSGRDRPKKPISWVPVDEFGEPIPLSEEETVRLHDRASNLCLWHLGQGPRTRKQLSEAMSRRGIPPEMADEILERLEDYRYVDDKAYADNYVRSRHESQRKGASVIRMELLRKGVDSETVAEALEQVTEESERENANTLVERKMRSTRGLDRQKRTNRLVGMLSRKGYPPGVAFQVVREALENEEPDDEDWTSR